MLTARDEPKPAAQPPRLSRPVGSVEILNGTTTAGLATVARREIRKRVPHHLIPTKGIRIGNAIDQRRERSTVLFLTGRDASARRIAELFRISDVKRVSPEVLARNDGVASSTSIVVLIGRDLSSACVGRPTRRCRVR